MGGNFRPYEPLAMTLHRLMDACMGAGLFLALGWFFNMYAEGAGHYLVLAILILFVSLVIFHVLGIYRSWRIDYFFLEARQLFSGCLGVYVLLFITGYFLKMSSEFSRRVVLIWMITWPILLVTERLVIRNFLKYQRQKGRNLKTCVIAGAGDLGVKLVRWVEKNPWSGTKIIGFFDDKVVDPVEGYPILGNLEAIPAFIQVQAVDYVYLTLPMRAEAKIQRLVSALADSTVSVYLVPDVFFLDLFLGGTVTLVDDLPIIALRDTPLQGINAFLKRTEDLVLTSLVLVAAAPVFLVIALIIKLTSPGPVFFKQWRYGLNGKAILIYKFRTMTVCEDGYQFQQAIKCDPRLTPIGAFLRKTSLDELPQLINVLQGRMSLVGPRPHPVAMNEEYRKLVPGYMLRHKVRPGLTGLAQISGWRGETDTLDKMQKRIDHDLNYLRQWSLLLDLKIIFKTVANGSWRMNAF